MLATDTMSFRERPPLGPKLIAMRHRSATRALHGVNDGRTTECRGGTGNRRASCGHWHQPYCRRCRGESERRACDDDGVGFVDGGRWARHTTQPSKKFLPYQLFTVRNDSFYV